MKRGFRPKTTILESFHGLEGRGKDRTPSSPFGHHLARLPVGDPQPKSPLVTRHRQYESVPTRHRDRRTVVSSVQGKPSLLVVSLRNRWVRRNGVDVIDRNPVCFHGSRGGTVRRRRRGPSSPYFSDTLGTSELVTETCQRSSEGHK